VVHECRSNADQRLISSGTRIFCPKLVTSDLCTKIDRPVIDVLREKHPPLREPSDIRGLTFEPYITLPDPPLVDISVGDN
jgi:hypothetical protein